MSQSARSLTSKLQQACVRFFGTGRDFHQHASRQSAQYQGRDLSRATPGWISVAYGVAFGAAAAATVDFSDSTPSYNAMEDSAVSMLSPGSSMAVQSSRTSGSWEAASSAMGLLRQQLSMNLSSILSHGIISTALAETKAHASAPGFENLVETVRADQSAAVAALMTAPIAAMLQGTVLSNEALQLVEQALEAHGLSKMDQWQLTAAAFGLACLGGQAGPALRETLRASLAHHGLPLAEVAIRVWSLAVMGAMTQETWGQVVEGLARRPGLGEIDDITSLFLLHAAMLTAGDSSAPRASKSDVQAALQRLPRKVSKKVLEVYDRLMPMNLCVLSHMMVIMHAIRALPSLCSSSSSGSSSGKDSSGSTSSGSAGNTGYLQQHLLPAVLAATAGSCSAAAAAAAQPHELARVRRDLDCLFRDGDEGRQKVLNEATYLCQRRLGPAIGPVVNAPDLDLVLPQSRTVLLVDVSVCHEPAPEPAKVGKPFTLEAGSQALVRLVSSHFRPTGDMASASVMAGRPGANPGHSQSCVGVENAMLRSARERGWTVRQLSAEQWKELKKEQDKLAALQRALAGRSP